LLIPEDDFYEEDLPREFQQGDVLVGVPLLFLPENEELLLLREAGTRARVPELPAGQVQVVREKAIGDAFDEPEFVGVAAARVAAVLMTQTCDLTRSEFWTISPLSSLSPELDRGGLYGGYFKKLFPYPKHAHFDESLIDITELHSIRRSNVTLSNRIASVKLPIQQLLSDRFLHAMGRRWGHAKDEDVPQDGNYRCLGCNDFDMPVQERPFKKGEKFTDCGRCAAIRRSAQWYLLRTPREKQLAAIK
jgi:hypothetical protein